MRFRCTAVMSVCAAALFGFAGIGAGVAQAAVVVPASLSVPAVFSATDPPGPCRTDEIGQRKRGPDGRMYECRRVPAGT